MFRPINQITHVGEFKLRQKWYGAFETNTEETNRQHLLESWTTPAQREYNRSHTPCQTCNGQGYTSKGKARKGYLGHGCLICGGTGALPCQ